MYQPKITMPYQYIVITERNFVSVHQLMITYRINIPNDMYLALHALILQMTDSKCVHNMTSTKQLTYTYVHQVN